MCKSCDHSNAFVKGALFGTLIGAVLGVLYAPKAGSETRDLLNKETEKLKKQGKEKYEDLRAEYEPKLEEAGKKLKPILDKISDAAQDLPEQTEQVKEKLRKPFFKGTA
jgi:gas vesicle protein